jgi:hypothetical protein
MATQMPHDMPTCLLDAGRRLHSGRLPSAPGNIPSLMRDARWAVGRGPWAVDHPWCRQISLHGIPISGHLYRGAPCPRQPCRKFKPPRQANRETRREELRTRICPAKSSSTALSLSWPTGHRLSLFCFSRGRPFLPSRSLLYLRSHSLVSSHDLFLNALLPPPLPHAQAQFAFYLSIIYSVFASS